MTAMPATSALQSISTAFDAGHAAAIGSPRGNGFGSLLDAVAGWRGSLIDTEHSYDAGDLCAQAAQFAQRLQQLGIGPGAIVVIATGSNAAFLPALLGASAIGACPLPLAAVTAPAVLEALVKHTDPVVLLVPAARASMLAAAVDGIACGDTLQGCAVIVRDTAAHSCAALAGAIAIASSGTTGLPKIVVHDPRNMLANARLHAASIDLRQGDRFLLALPCHFSFGFVAGLLAPILVDADIVLADQPISVASWMTAVIRRNISVFSATPSLIRRLIAAGPFPPSLRVVSIGGDELLPDDLHRLRAVFRGPIHLTYGLSEAGPRVFTRSFAPTEPAPDSTPDLHVGVAFPGIECRLLQAVRQEGGDVGELALLTPTAMLGRWNGAELLREDFDGHWLKTGDVFRRNARGELQFVSRKKELIVVGGEKIGAALIRRVLLEHPAVVAARVWPESDAELGQVPMAAVRFADSEGRDETATPTTVQLLRWCAARLRRIELPRRIDVDPALPISFK